MKNCFLSTRFLPKKPVGTAGFFFFNFNFQLIRIYRNCKGKRLFSKNVKKKNPVGPFMPTQAVDRKQLFI